MNKYYEMLQKVLENGREQRNKKGNIRYLTNEVMRMDADTVSATQSHEVLLERFRKKRVPVLLGTQMVAKGLDFENVTLVGVIDADLSLYTDNYRAAAPLDISEKIIYIDPATGYKISVYYEGCRNAAPESPGGGK